MLLRLLDIVEIYAISTSRATTGNTRGGQMWDELMIGSQNQEETIGMGLVRMEGILREAISWP